MSGLLYLTGEDFYVSKEQKGPMICHNIPGFSLLLFYSVNCAPCKIMLEIFKRLPGSLGGCQFGLLNVDTNKPLILLSEKTLTPIRFVPYVVFYYNGQPLMRYDGEYKKEGIEKFILDVSNNIQKKQQFSKEKVKESPETGIPAYTIGIPVSGDKNRQVCYFTNDKAYKPNAR